MSVNTPADPSTSFPVKVYSPRVSITFMQHPKYLYLDKHGRRCRKGDEKRKKCGQVRRVKTLPGKGRDNEDRAATSRPLSDDKSTNPGPRCRSHRSRPALKRNFSILQLCRECHILGYSCCKLDILSFREHSSPSVNQASSRWHDKEWDLMEADQAQERVNAILAKEFPQDYQKESLGYLQRVE
jgi:hypothetical protein